MTPLSSDALGAKYLRTRAEAERALALLALEKNTAVLDIGTGKGYFAIALAQKGLSVTTGEPLEDDGLYARQPWRDDARLMEVDDRIEFQSFNAAKMPFDNDYFAAVFFFGVLHHIAEQERQPSLSEAYRITKKGGAIVIFEPTKTMLEELWQRDPDHPEAADPDLYRPQDLKPAQRFAGETMDMMIYRKT
ncbi:class I SAM-dependent methyltransferase [Woodsholea maritima]|uniref:class I SAM-dependent methyltransferase n=1 Tax=Woodsholea maritima TaxID=240237 RepID=UPI00037CAE19|nr:class I SAM-dependent methyltransferase [Woodsholea maritima]